MEGALVDPAFEGLQLPLWMGRVEVRRAQMQ